MRVGILGSWIADDKDWAVKGTHEEFSGACRELGHRLAAHRQVVIVGGDSTTTADHYVVEGVVESLRGATVEHPLVEVIPPSDYLNKGFFEEAVRCHPNLFSFHSPTQKRPIEAHLMVIRESDVVFTICGMTGTYQAGLAAIVARKSLVPIASFGGASARLLSALELLEHGEDLRNLRVLNSPWSDYVLQTALKRAGVGRLPRLLIVHGRSEDRYKLELWLRKQGGLSEVFVMQQEFGAGRSLPEKFEGIASGVDGAIVVATPDDLGGSKDEDANRPRARQNVWLEVGWFWGRLGRSKVFVLCKGDVEIPSDLQGVEYYRYTDHPGEAGDSLRAFLQWLKT